MGKRRLDHRIEALDVPHLEGRPTLLGQSDDLVGLIEGLGEGLLDQHRLPRLQVRKRRLEVQRRRHHDAHRIDMLHESLGRRVQGNIVLASNLFAPFPVRIDHPHELHPRHLRIHTRVQLPQMPDSNHPNPHHNLDLKRAKKTTKPARTPKPPICDSPQSGPAA